MSRIPSRRPRSCPYPYPGQHNCRHTGLSRSPCTPVRTGHSRRSPGSRRYDRRPRSFSYRKKHSHRNCRRPFHGRNRSGPRPGVAGSAFGSTTGAAVPGRHTGRSDRSARRDRRSRRIRSSRHRSGDPCMYRCRRSWLGEGRDDRVFR